MALFVIPIILVAAAVVAVILLRPKAVGQDSQAQEITDSAYGNFINIGRGRMRLTADLIYARPLIKDRHSEGSGKKKTKVTDWYLTGIYLVADASIFGPAKTIVRMWADESLIYDATGESELDIKDGITVRFMYGTEDQEPDVIQVEDEGDLAQGFPFSICVIFERFPLKSTSDRPPNLTVEVDFESVPSFAGRSAGVDNAPAYADDRVLFVDWGLGVVYVTDEDGFSNDSFILEYDLFTQAYTRTLSLAAATQGVTFFKGIDRDTGYLYGWDGIGGGVYYWQVFDPVSGTYITDQIWGGDEANDLFGTGLTPWLILTSPGGLAKNMMSYDPGGGNSGQLVLFYAADDGAFNVKFLWPDVDYTTGCQPVEGRRGEAFLIIWKITEAQILQYELSDGGVVTQTQILVFTPADIGATDFRVGLSTNQEAHYDPSTRALVFPIETDSGANFREWMAVDIDLASIKWTVNLRNGNDIFVNSTQQNTKLGTSRVIALFPNDNFYDIKYLNLDTGAITTETVPDVTHGAGDFLSFYNGTSNCLYVFYDLDTLSGNQRLDKYCFEIPIGFVSVANVIREVCVRVGLVEGTDFSVSAVTSSVWGWAVSSRQKANELLADIMAPFFVQAGTQDGLIKFKDREQNSIATVSFEEFIQDDDDKNVLPYTITEDEESKLPSEVTVGYLDPARDYEAGAAPYRRPGFPDQPILSHEKVDMGTPFALTPAEAKAIAYKWTFIPWLERDSIKGRLDWNHIEYVGNDIVSFDLGNGVVKKSRITKASIRDDLTIDIEAVFIEPGAAVAAVFASSSGSFTRASRLVPVPASVQYILDINLLRDVDDSGQLSSVTYVAATEQSPPNVDWNGAVTFRSYDQIEYEEVSDTIEAVVVGVTTTLLDTPADPFGTEFDSTLDVRIPSGGDLLSSITYQSFLSSGNPFIILKSSGFEIGQFQDITFLGGTDYRLSILGRGKRGTDTMVGNNAIGNIIIFPTEFTMSAFTGELARLGMDTFFRTISSGGDFNDGSDTAQPIVGNDLKPYAPVNFAVVREGNDDLTITFDRRTRIGSGFVSGVWQSPLSEGSENYEVDIGATVLRTLSATTPSFTYTIAQQTTDGFAGTETEIWIEIFQLSDLVGRGYSYKLLTDIA